MMHAQHSTGSHMSLDAKNMSQDALHTQQSASRG